MKKIREKKYQRKNRENKKKSGNNAKVNHK
jgi:hypothetical protein